MEHETLLKPAKALFYRGKTMAVLCKVKCHVAQEGLSQHDDKGECSLTVSMSALWEGSTEKQRLSENAIFGKSMPHMDIIMTIKDPVAARQFVQGKKYYVTFAPID
jgi:hypothetical protein